MNEEQKKHMADYRKEFIKRIPLDMKKCDYEILKEHADSSGKTVNGYIKHAIKCYMETYGRIESSSFSSKDVLDVIVHNDDILNNVFLPYLASSDVDIVGIIYSLLNGISLGNVADKRLEKYADDLKYYRTLIKLWEARGEGNYTIKDIPQWVFDRVSRETVSEIISKLANLSENLTEFAIIPYYIHFNLFGYDKLILYMEDRKVITESTKDKWMRDVHMRANKKGGAV